MVKARQFIEPIRQCSYLPERKAQMVYAEVDKLSSQEYLDLLSFGWRRFGYTLFRTQCPTCTSCESIRVPVQEYKPNRSQRRLIKQNSSLLRLEIGVPKTDQTRVDLYVAHHQHHAETRGWPLRADENAIYSIVGFTIGPLPVQEWAFYLEDELVAIAYVDHLPGSFSGIYFYYSPQHSKLSLGNWICISMILKAQELNLDYVHFGYYVKGNISMEYKAAFAPNQILQPDGSWKYFKTD